MEAPTVSVRVDRRGRGRSRGAVAPLQQLEAAVHQDFQHGQRPNQERRRRGQQQLSSVKRAGKQPVRPGQAAVQAQGPEAPELATEGRVQEPAEAPLCVVCCDVLKVAAVGVCNHKEVCARCSLRMRLCYGDMKCSLCKTDLPEVVMARWRPQGIPDWSAYEARRKGLWQRPHWARGVLIDDWKPRDSEARPLHLDMVALTAQACPKCDPEGLRPYPSNKSLTRHVEFEHEMKMCLTCLAARRQFPLELPVYTRAELREHMQEHPNCQFCDIQFYGLDELFHHMQRTHFTCHVCQMAGTYCHFAQADELIVHLREEHYLCEEEECELCFVAFRTVQELQQHHREVHLNRMPRFDRSRARRVNLADMVSPVRGNGPSGAPRNAQAAGANAQAAAQARQQRSAQRALHVSDSSNSLSAESGGFEAEPLQQGQGGFMMIDDDVGLAQPGIPQPSSSRPASTRPPREDFPELPSSGAPAYRAPPRPQRLAGRPAEEFPALQASAGPAPPQAAAASRPALVRLTVKCPCGRRSSHSVVEQGQTPAPLQCDTDCERQKRQQQIAGAFGIADPAHHVPVFDRNRTPHYSQELLLYAWNNPYWIDGVEHALAAFANDKAKKRQRMAPMPRQQRAMAHALAAEYGLTTQSIGTEPARCVELFQSATASVPNKLLSATVAGMTREQILQVEDKVAGHCMYFYDVEEGVDLEPFLGQWRGQFTLEVTGPDTAVARFQTPELLKEARVLMGGGLRGLFRIQVPKSAPGQGSDTIQAGPSHGSASAPRAEGAPQLAGGSSRRAPARQQGAGGAAEGGRQSAGDSGEDWQPVAGAGRGRQQVADQAQDSEPEREAAADSVVVALSCLLIVGQPPGGGPPLGPCGLPPSVNSVAAIHVPGMNLTGSLPTGLFADLVDLQLLNIQHNPGLGGPMPSMPPALQAKMQVLNARSTSLRNPCPFPTDKLATAGALKKCLPDFVTICSQVVLASRPGMICPILGFKRPQPPPSLLYQLSLKLNAMEQTAAASGLLRLYNPDAQTEALLSGMLDGTVAQPVCYDMGPTQSVLSADDWQSAFLPITSVDFEPMLYGFAGCTCADGYDTVYTADSQGDVLLECNLQTGTSKTVPMLIVILVPIIVGCSGLIGLLVWGLYKLGWQQHYERFTTKRLKLSHAPGTLKETAAKKLGLVHKEITLVMTDVEGSTELWEWNPEVTKKAIDMHDETLRSLLKTHFGYEVTTEGDAFTMAFHDPIDAIGWALHVQYKLLQLPWPAELLTHHRAAEEKAMVDDEETVIFRGLRVRMGINTGVPEYLQMHNVTKQLEYHGYVTQLTEAIINLPAGGQILMGSRTFERTYGRLDHVTISDDIQIGAFEGEAGRKSINAKSRMHSRGDLLRPPGLPGSGAATANGNVDAIVNSDLVRQGSKAIRDDRIRTTGSVELRREQNRSSIEYVRGGGARTSLEMAMRPAPETTMTSFQRPVQQGRTIRISRERKPDSFLLPSSPKSDPVAPWDFAGQQQEHQQRPPEEGTGWLGWIRTQLSWPFVGRMRVQPLDNVIKMSAPLQTDLDQMVNSSGHQGATTCMVMDMGVFYFGEFSQPANQRAEEAANTAAAPVLDGCHVLQILPFWLASRFLSFPRLDVDAQIAPSFSDAPGADFALLPGMAEKDAEKANVTIVFARKSAHKELAALDAKAAAIALNQFQSCVRTLLLVSSGYECQEKEGLFMIAFPEPRAAVEWAILLQMALMRVPWAEQLKNYAPTKHLFSPSGDLLFSGLSAKVGIFHGSMAKVCPHATTGRADYFGLAVNRAARLMAATKVGQILAEESIVELVVQQWTAISFTTNELTCVPAAAANALALKNCQLLSNLSRPSASLSKDKRGVKSTSYYRTSNDQPMLDHQNSSAAIMNLNELASLQASSPTPDPGLSADAEEAQRLLSVRIDSGAEASPSGKSSPSPSHGLIHLGSVKRGSMEEAFRRPNKVTLSVPMPGDEAHSGESQSSDTIPAATSPSRPRRLSMRMSSVSPLTSRRTSSICYAQWAQPAGPGYAYPSIDTKVEVWALGTFAFKGVPEQIKVMQIYPGSLAGRLQLYTRAATRFSKAVRVDEGSTACRFKGSVALLDVLNLKLARDPLELPK
ncbi:hypothetical protein WJX72_007454 [[Myrmecia] bisecta]|uniref:RING-type E3 ubiquitin transferase n=1 Tax=[Myrmecia] bisecta TaxID=41462 RepID=A0AAW1Q5Z7_9CHLO